MPRLRRYRGAPLKKWRPVSRGYCVVIPGKGSVSGFSSKERAREWARTELGSGVKFRVQAARAFHGDFFGVRYDPHHPWILQTYKGGGGLPKMLNKFATQEQAAYALQQYALADDTKPGDRWVYRIRHARGQWSADSITDESLSRYEYDRIAMIQWKLHLMWRGYAGRTRTRTRTR